MNIDRLVACARVVDKCFLYTFCVFMAALVAGGTGFIVMYTMQKSE